MITYLFMLGFFGLNVVDVIATWFILKGGGIELNPVGAYFMSIGWGWAIAYKLIGALIVCGIIYYTREKKASMFLGISLNTLMFGICFWNIGQLLRWF